ncbi:hypothetical protein FRC11_000162 [Ceratobasidium sp. 423]|nr:hypothetical protein FRC11_000162 [Ceratobasidium sp. 423]
MGQGLEGSQPVDFPAGAPAFMPVRALEVGDEERYPYSFLDGMESFFWLIHWSAAAHLDDGVRQHTAAAQSMLNSLNRHDLNGVSLIKLGILCYCSHTGIDMRKSLEKFGNSWASHPTFIDVTLKFGKLTWEYRYDAIDSEMQDSSPAKVFLAVVGVFMNALSGHLE